MAWRRLLEIGFAGFVGVVGGDGTGVRGRAVAVVVLGNLGFGFADGRMLFDRLDCLTLDPGTPWGRSAGMKI